MTQTRTALLITLAAALTTAATAQTTAPKKSPASPTHPAATAVHSAAPATTTQEPPCSKLPEISPKIPAVPAGLPCARPLYTITTEPPVKLTYVSPLEGAALRETLGLETSSFSLDYIDLKVGAGELAAPHKWYRIHYTGYLTDGTKFDSSVDRGEPIEIPYGGHQVIPGWDTGFDGMHVGGKRRLFIPYQLAYGANGKPPAIPARAELVFDVELVSQSDTQTPPPAAPQPPVDPAKPAADPAKPATPPQAK